MGGQPNIPGGPGIRMPFTMIDLDNFAIITSRPIPGDIRDQKKIIMAETAIPGLGYQPVTPGGMGNDHISFSLPLINRNNTVGNTLLVKQLEQLRNQVTPLLNPFAKSQFVRNPKVLFFWGTGRIPLIYWVAKCDFTHNANFVNGLGFPQYSTAEIELVVDHESPIYAGELVFRKVAAVVGTALNTFQIIQSGITGQRPY